LAGKMAAAARAALEAGRMPAMCGLRALLAEQLGHRASEAEVADFLFSAVAARERIRQAAAAELARRARVATPAGAAEAAVPDAPMVRVRPDRVPGSGARRPAVPAVAPADLAAASLLAEDRTARPSVRLAARVVLRCVRRGQNAALALDRFHDTVTTREHTAAASAFARRDGEREQREAAG
jgi:hypothetical protein